MTIPWGSDKVSPHEYDGSATTAQTVVAGSAGKTFRLVRLAAVTADANVLRVYHTSNAAGTRLVSGKFGAGGGVAWQYQQADAPIVPAATDLMVVCAGSCTVVAEGYKQPV